MGYFGVGLGGVGLVDCDGMEWVKVGWGEVGSES